MELPAELLELLSKPSLCFVATSMPDGSPHLTQTWADTDGKHVLINTVDGFRKVRNVTRDARVALNVVDAARPHHYFAIRGRVLETTTEGGAEHIDKLAQRYTGAPYAWYGGHDQVRLVWKIEADHITQTGG